MAHALALARLESPYTVDCIKCGNARPAHYFAWVPGQAVRDRTCNACMRSRSGRYPGPTPPAPPEPFGPTARARAEARAEARRAYGTGPLPAGMTPPRIAAVVRWLRSSGLPGPHTPATVYAALRGKASVRDAWPTAPDEVTRGY